MTLYYPKGFDEAMDRAWSESLIGGGDGGGSSGGGGGSGGGSGGGGGGSGIGDGVVLCCVRCGVFDWTWIWWRGLCVNVVIGGWNDCVEIGAGAFW